MRFPDSVLRHKPDFLGTGSEPLAEVQTQFLWPFLRLLSEPFGFLMSSLLVESSVFRNRTTDWGDGLDGEESSVGVGIRPTKSYGELHLSGQKRQPFKIGV